MELQAKRHWGSSDVIVITRSDMTQEQGNVVARYNEKHDALGRTNRAKGISTKAIRDAIAKV